MKSSKVCTGCGKEYPLSHLYWETTASGKYTSKCRSCIRKQRYETKELRRNGYRLCPTCKEIKPLSDFSNARGRTNCNICKSKTVKAEDLKKTHEDILQVKTYGLNDVPFDIELNTTERYVIKYPESHKDGRVIIKGKIIQMTDRFFVLQSDTGIREAFTYDDYKLGEYALEVKQ